MKRKRSANLIVAILAVVMLFGLVGFGYNSINGEGIAVTAVDADNPDVKIDIDSDGLEAKLVFEEPAADAEEGEEAPDADDVPAGEEVPDAEEAPAGKVNSNAEGVPASKVNSDDEEETVEIPRELELSWNSKAGKIIIEDAKETICTALNYGYKIYLQVTASAGDAYYKYKNFSDTDDSNNGTSLESLIDEENGTAEFGTLTIEFKKIPVATVSFVASGNNVYNLIARDGNAVATINGNKNEATAGENFDVNVKATDEFTFELVDGFKVASISINDEEMLCDSVEGVAEKISAIDKDSKIIVAIKKVDITGPTFGVQVQRDSATNKRGTIVVSNVKDDYTNEATNIVVKIDGTVVTRNENGQYSKRFDNVFGSIKVEAIDLAGNTTETIACNGIDSATSGCIYDYDAANETPCQNAVVRVKISESLVTNYINTNYYYRLQLVGPNSEISDKNWLPVTLGDTYTFTMTKAEYQSYKGKSFSIVLSRGLAINNGGYVQKWDDDYQTIGLNVELDTVAPVISYRGYANDPTIGFKDSDTIYATDVRTGFNSSADVTEAYKNAVTGLSNTTGIYKLEYTARKTVQNDNGETVLKKSGEILDGSESIKIFAESDYTGMWEFTVTATDRAGNTATNEFTVVYDITPPKVGSVTYSPELKNGFANAATTATISVSDNASTLDGCSATITYKASGEKDDVNYETKVNGDNKIEIKFNEDGVYEIIAIAVTDKAGNTTVETDAEKLGGEFVIDTKNPEIGSVTFNPATTDWNEKYYSTVRTATITVNDKNTIGGSNLRNGSVTIVKDRDDKNPIVINIKDDGNLGETNRQDVTVEGNVITFAEDGVYEITKISATDKAGRTTEVENGAAELGGEFVIDKTAPAIDSVDFGEITAKLDKYPNFYDQARPVEIKVSDTNLDSGYVVYTKDGEKHSVAIENGVARIPFEEDGVYKITEISVTDMAGNTTVATPEKTIYFESGIQITVYTKNDLGGEFVIDKTAPEIGSVEFASKATVWNEKYYSDVRKATITVTDKNTVNSSNLLEGTITFTKDYTANVDPQPEKITATFTAYENGNISIKMPEGCKETAENGVITFNDNSIYVITEISATDKAGNTTVVENDAAELGGEFVIDKASPEVEVKYAENSGPANDKYYNVIRTATITVKEHNFDNSIVILDNETFDDVLSRGQSGVFVKISQVTGDPESDPSIVDFRFPTDSKKWQTKDDDPDTHTLTITYDSNEAYLFEVLVVDMAGLNDKRVPGDGNPATNYDFTVDKDIVPPAITGVSNGAAYPDDCVPVITFTDANFNTGVVHIFRTRDGQINRDVTEQFATGLSANGTGGVMTLNRFEKIPENDGIYTIVANMADKAGNTSESRVTFSINRFGSVYKLGESLADIRGQHVQKVDKDFTITEINPDQLIDGSLKVSITRNGKPIETQFSVKPGANNPTIGASGWYEYVYTIDAANFEEDGFYTITVSSTDRAGNNSSTSSFEECRMEFWVDSTKSEFTSLVGLEKAIINAKTAPVTLSVYDEIGISKITVYCDDEIIAVFEGDDINDINNFEGKFEVPSGRNQVVRIVVEDLSGNITDTEQLIKDGTLPEFMENIQNITVSTNFFVRWFANKLVFFSSIIGIIALGAGAWWLLIGKKRKDEDEEEEQTAAK